MVKTKNEFYLLRFSAPTKCCFYADAGGKTVKTKNEFYFFSFALLRPKTSGEPADGFNARKPD